MVYVFWSFPTTDPCDNIYPFRLWSGKMATLTDPLTKLPFWKVYEQLFMHPESPRAGKWHYGDVMGTIASQITSLMIVYLTVYSGADQRKYQCSASLAFVPGIHRWPVNSPHKWPVTRKMFPFNDVIMKCMSNDITPHWNSLIPSNWGQNHNAWHRSVTQFYWCCLLFGYMNHVKYGSIWPPLCYTIAVVAQLTWS